MPEESRFVDDGFTFHHHGRRASQDYYRKTNLALHCLEHSPRTILEVGAGFGQTARLLLAHDATLGYAIIDMPDSLTFIADFLRLHFPEKLILIAGGERDFGRPCDVLLVSAIMADAYAAWSRPVDVLLNSSRIVGMPYPVGREFLDAVRNAVKPTHLILLDRLFSTYDPEVQAVLPAPPGHFRIADGAWQTTKVVAESECLDPDGPNPELVEEFYRLCHEI